MENSKIFDEKYQEYLPLIKNFDFSKKAEILGIQTEDQSSSFKFFNRRIIFDRKDFNDVTGNEVTFAIKVLLCKYLLMCPEKISENSNRLVTFREFINAGPLFSYFATNTGKIIETTFSGNLEKLKKQCLKLGGIIMETESYDLSVRFLALPRIPVILNFNDKDELMPAKAVFLYHENADVYLDLQSLTITCTYLTGLLIQSR
ncbi:MAG: DUF3786 domain-containing protein [Desulfosarcina sp.]|nr:DUF3786 domain-containing protein [Desulfobacterales bacterium]